MTTRLCAILMAMAMCGLATAATINVPADYTTIQAAIDAASVGDEILVSPGTYMGTGNWVINPHGKPITIRATGTPEETILNGQGHRCVVQCSGAEGADTIIEGFTITGGSSATSGGGINCSNSSPTITGCTITDNTANNFGGGIRFSNSSATITSCTISANTANYGGGGIYCNSGNPTITDCTISGNIAENGGGIYCYSGSPTITGCTISGNLSEDFGSGLYLGYEPSCTLQDTSICSNFPAYSQVFGDYTDNGGNTIAEVCPLYQGACCTGNELACVVASEEDCEHFGHTWLGSGTTCDDAPCPTSCLGDVTQNGHITTVDLLVLLKNWGPCP